MLARGKHSSLIRKLITYDRKKFYNIGAWTLRRSQHTSSWEQRFKTIICVITDVGENKLQRSFCGADAWTRWLNLKNLATDKHSSLFNATMWWQNKSLKRTKPGQPLPSSLLWPSPSWRSLPELGWSPTPSILCTNEAKTHRTRILSHLWTP